MVPKSLYFDPFTRANGGVNPLIQFRYEGLLQQKSFIPILLHKPIATESRESNCVTWAYCNGKPLFHSCYKGLWRRKAFIRILLQGRFGGVEPLLQTCYKGP